MTQNMTLFRLLKEGNAVLSSAGVSDAELDAKLLLLKAFDLDQVHFLMNQRQALTMDHETKAAIDHYRELIGRREHRIPLQQILGTAGFMGMDFKVDEHVLIPRQDTETLVELVLSERPDPEQKVLDLCTGSGCIAVSLAVMGHYCSVTGADISTEALRVAGENRDALVTEHPGRVTFVQGDLFEALPAGERYDIITSNPPYIPTKVIEGLEPEVREHEPMLALDGDKDGLCFYRAIVRTAGRYLNPGGSIYLEIGYDQGVEVRELLSSNGFHEVRVIRDLSGNDRVVCAQAPMIY